MAVAYTKPIACCNCYFNAYGTRVRRTALGLEFWISSGAVPEVENFNGSPVLVEAVIDVERRVEKPPDVRMPFYWRADVRKGLQELEVVEKIIGKLLGCFGMLFPRPLEDFFQVG